MLKRRRGILLVALLALSVPSYLLVKRATGQEAGASEAVAQAILDMEGASPARVFTVSRDLDRLGHGAVAAVKAQQAGAGPRARVGLARYLLGQDERKVALDMLVDVIGSDDAEAAALSAELVERYARSRDEVERLGPLLETVREPAVKIAVAKALRAKARDTSAERILKDYLGSEDFEVRAMAALALGELGNVEAAKAVLGDLSDEPTERGKRAKSLLYQEKLFESLRRTQGLDQEKQVELLEAKIERLEEELEEAKKGGSPGDQGHKLIAELIRNIKSYYVEDGEVIDEKKLFDEAAKGLVGSLDPFSSYMTEKETAEFAQSMAGKYAGIGAVVSMDPKDKLLTIIRPIYSGPAYKAGLRSLDKITQVEGESTFGKSVEELVSKLKGDPDTPVKMKVYRKGWKKERDFTLTRAEIQLQSVHYAMLPGKIGYISLSQFGDEAVHEVEDALVTLEGQGMKALVFDLRANPGGLLTAAVDIADKFLKDNKLIVYSQGRNPHIAPRREYRTAQSSTHPDYPLVVLVNGASASASEIVSGALQEHGRAQLVGTTTFGKGSVQQLLRVRSTGGASRLRLTIAKYYLPSGRSIHRDPKTGIGGVSPDISVEPESLSTWEIEEADKVLETGLLEGFVEGIWKEHKADVKPLAEFDGHDPARYPGFDELYGKLKTPLDKERVRAMVRDQVRRLAQDDNGREFATDLQEDVQLQRGIFELLKKSGQDAQAFDEYKGFAEKFAEAPKEQKPAEGEVR